MTALLAPFVGYLPTAEFAQRIALPKRSMMTKEQVAAGRDDPLNFRFSIGRGSGATQESAQEWVRTGVDQGALRPIGPAVLVYRITHGELTSTGLLAEVSIAAYDSGLVKRHEMTLESDEKHHADYLRVAHTYGNPVALCHRPHAAISDAIDSQIERSPDLSFTTVDGHNQEVWAIEGADATTLCAAYTEELYITDGHHRMAAGSMVAAEGQGDLHLPAALFAPDELELRTFSRAVKDPEVDPDQMIERLSAVHDLVEVERTAARPRRRFECGVKVGDRYFRLHFDSQQVPGDLYGSLDVNLLQDLVLEPVFGIENPRQDKRLSFIADTPGDNAIERNATANFLPYPVAVADVLDVSDMGRVMPPKSTWFGPKIPAGIIVRVAGV